MRLEVPRVRRIARTGGILAGLLASSITAALLALRGLVTAGSPGLVFGERAAVLLGEGPGVAWAGFALHLLGGATLGGLFATFGRLRSGLELALRGAACAAALWAAAALASHFLAPGLADAAPSLAESVIFGLFLGTEAQLTRRMLRHEWRRG